MLCIMLGTIVPPILFLESMFISFALSTFNSREMLSHQCTKIWQGTAMILLLPLQQSARRLSANNVTSQLFYIYRCRSTR